MILNMWKIKLTKRLLLWLVKINKKIKLLMKYGSDDSEELDTELEYNTGIDT